MFIGAGLSPLMNTGVAALCYAAYLALTVYVSINAHLMAQAKWLLGSSSLSVLEISYRLGFQNQSHFGTFFKRHEGLPPAAFRKKKE